MNEMAVIEKQVMDAGDRARALVVATRTDYDSAIELSKNYKELQKEIVATFLPIKAKAKAAHDEACAQEKRHLAPVLEIQRIIDGKAMVWYRAEQAKLEEEHRQREALARKQEEDRRLAQAEHLSKNGQAGAADALMEAPVVVSVPKIEVKKTEGYAITEHWTFEIVDAMLIPPPFTKPDEVKIGQYVRAMKSQAVIPGDEKAGEAKK